MSYKEVELHGRKIRVYSENHIEMEFRNKAGDWRHKAISISTGGYAYFTIDVNGKTCQIAIHRLIFYAHNPSWDIYNSSNDNSIDHSNGNPLDNRIENLRCVTHQENMCNRLTAKGYSWSKRNNKWKAHIRVNHNRIHLGYFTEESDAREAYLAAKLKYHIIEERVF